MASTSWTYDVFLSFRGEDTRNSFTGHLYEALERAGIHTFMDSEELQRGTEISQELCEAIDGSRFLVVVFSKNYASSMWCLEELVRIMGCMELPNGRQMALPVFYDVDPSEVRKQGGVFGEAFTRHEERFKEDLEKVQRWREALTKAANLSGCHLNQRSEPTLIKDIVQEILTKKINRTLLTIATNPVGIDFHVEQLKPTLGLEFDDVRMIGIYGLGGIGKTTIAKAIYNLIADRFDGCSFVPNIKEKCGSLMHNDGLVKLQELLLQDILSDKMHWSINFVDRGTNILRDSLGKKKVLIVLDDVDNRLHLEKLAGNVDWFGPGSRVIVTTRNKQLLDAHGIDRTYEINKLNHAHALELFCWNAFKKPHPDMNFVELSDVVVRYAAGLPLALIVVGASLCHCSKAQWESELQKLRRIPKKDVQEILKLSFDGLDDNEKTIFLDIACFFKGEEVGPVMSFLYHCGFYPNSGIEVLKKKCLIYIDEYNNTFQMHDLIQLMGREIVRQESPSDLGRRSRLWCHKDVLQVLNENEGTLAIQGIYLNMPNVEVCLQKKTFSNMKKLRLLIIRGANVIGTPQYLSNELRWLECTGPSSVAPPSTFNPKELVVLNIQRCSSIKKFGIGLKGFENLRYLNFEGCEMLTEIGDISMMPNLVYLDLSKCSNLEFFSSGLKSKSLKKFYLRQCYKLKKFPDILEEMECLKTLLLIGSGITELPTSIENLTGLQNLYLRSCTHLVRLPSSIYRLKNLCNLLLSGCPRLEKFPEPSNSTAVSSSSEEKHIQDSMTCLDNSYHSTSATPLTLLGIQSTNMVELDFIMASNYFISLETLLLTAGKIKRLPRGMSKFKRLKSIFLINCKQLEDISDLPPNISQLYAIGCESLPRLDVENFFDMKIIPKNGYLWRDWTEVFLCQGINNNKIVQFVLPGNEIPNSFIHSSSSGSISLQLPLPMKNHIMGILLFVVPNKEVHMFTLTVKINGTLVSQIDPIINLLFGDVLVAYVPLSLKFVKVLEDNTSVFYVTLQVESYHNFSRVIESSVKKFGIRLISDEKDEETYTSLWRMGEEEKLKENRSRIQRSEIAL